MIHGNRRIPADTVKARIFTHPGDVYDAAGLERDFNSLWNTGYFEDIRFEREQTPKGWRIHVYVKEKPTIREINYTGLSSVSTSDVLDRFKERKVGLSVESQYDPTRIKKAEVAIKELLAEHGRQFATIRSEIRPIPPAAVGITFVVKEGPKVKVGRIRFTGNRNIKSRTLRAAMKNLKPIGIPHSIFLENIFAKTYDATKLEEDTERVRNEYQNRGFFKVAGTGPEDRDPRHRPSGLPRSPDCRRVRQGRRHHDADRGRRTLQACQHHLQEQQGDYQHARRCVPCSRSKTATSSAAKKSARAWRTFAKPTASTATSTSRRFPIPSSTTRRS